MTIFISELLDYITIIFEKQNNIYSSPKTPFLKLEISRSRHCVWQYHMIFKADIIYTHKKHDS